jgi:hypothetical protein
MRVHRFYHFGHATVSTFMPEENERASHESAAMLFWCKGIDLPGLGGWRAGTHGFTWWRSAPASPQYVRAA